MTPAQKTLGAPIRSLRVERGYTQESFAVHAGTDRSYYGAIERGEFNVTLDARRAQRARLRAQALDSRRQRAASSACLMRYLDLCQHAVVSPFVQAQYRRPSI